MITSNQRPIKFIKVTYLPKTCILCKKTQIISKRTVVFRRWILPQIHRQIEIFLRLPFHTTHTYRIACILLHVRAHNKHWKITKNNYKTQTCTKSTKKPPQKNKTTRITLHINHTNHRCSVMQWCLIKSLCNQLNQKILFSDQGWILFAFYKANEEEWYKLYVLIREHCNHYFDSVKFWNGFIV